MLSEGVSSVTSCLARSAPQTPSLTSSMSVDTLREAQQYIDTVDYINKLKLRLEKLIAAAGALQKHGGHTVKVSRLCRVFRIARHARGQGAQGVHERERRLVEAPERLYAALIPTQREASDVMRSEFLDSLEEVNALWSVGRGVAARKRVVDHYNRVTASIERIESKLSTMGVPEPGPKREEKQKIELAASDLRIERTQTHNVTNDAAQTWNTN